MQKTTQQPKITTVAQSYAQRRRPLDKKVKPRLRYNPDTINQKEEKEIEM